MTNNQQLFSQQPEGTKKRVQHVENCACFKHKRRLRTRNCRIQQQILWTPATAILLLLLAQSVAVQCLSLPRKSSTRRSLDVPTILAPDNSFRDSRPGELSVASFKAALLDRGSATSDIIQRATKLNADIVCLQNVVEEGSINNMMASRENENDLSTSSGYYDACQWASLPKGDDEIVTDGGLATFWRSDRHMLLSSEKINRGLIVQLMEKKGGSVFMVANVCFSGGQDNTLARLEATTEICQYLESMRLPSTGTALDGGAVLVGDFECTTPSSPVQLVLQGSLSMAKFDGGSALANVPNFNSHTFRHGLQFINAYDYEGQSDSSTDHIFFVPGIQKESKKKQASKGNRRKRKAERRASAEASPLQVEALLAGADSTNDVHGPVGVLLTPETPQHCITNRYLLYNRFELHNALVEAVQKWLVKRGATDFSVEEPMKGKWFAEQDSMKPRMKRMTPDICCKIPSHDGHGGTLLIIEVTVAKDPESRLEEKQEKYGQLVESMMQADKIVNNKLTVLDPFVIVVRKWGDDSLDLSMDTLLDLAETTSVTSQVESNDDSVSDLVNELERIRDEYNAREQRW